MLLSVVAVSALCVAYGMSATRAQDPLERSLRVEIQGAAPEVFTVLALPPGYEGIGPQGLTSAQLAELSSRLDPIAKVGVVSCLRKSARLLGEGGSVVKAAVPYTAVSASFFSLMGYSPAEGRFFTEDEERSGPHVCVVGHARPDALGAEHSDVPGGMATPYTVVGRMPLLSGAPFPLPRIWSTQWVARDGTPLQDLVVFTPVTARAPLSYLQGDPSEVSASWLVPIVAPDAGQSEAAREVVQEYFSEVWPGATLDFGLVGSTAMVLENARARASLYSNLTFALMLALCAVAVGGFMTLVVGRRRRAMAIQRSLGKARVTLLLEAIALAGGLTLAGVLMGVLASVLLIGDYVREQLLTGGWPVVLLTRLALIGGATAAAGCLAGFWTAFWVTSAPPIQGLQQASVVRGRRAVDFRLPIAVLAVTLGASVLVCLLVSSRSSVAALSGYLQSVGEQVILVQQDIFRAQGPLQKEDFLGPAHASTLREELPGWKVVSVTVASTTLVRPDGRSQSVTAYGLDQPWPVEAGFRLAYGEIPGKGPTGPGAELDFNEVEGRPIVYVGARLAEALFGTDPALGQELALGGDQVRVIVGGVLAPRPAGVPDRLGDRDQSLFVSYEVLRQATSLAPPAATTEIWAYLPPGTDKELGQAKVAAVVDREWGGRTGISAEALVDQVSRLSRLERDMAGQQVVLGAAALLAAGWLVTLVMLARVADRRRELGLRRAVGAPRWRVVLYVLGQAGLACLTGGTLGSALGLLLATQYCRALGWPVVSGVKTPLEILGAVAVLGILVAVAPARQAMGEEPMGALREGEE